MPHIVMVRCSECTSAADFEFAEIVKIKRKQDIAYFKKNEQFDYCKFEDRFGQYWHGAIYYPGFSGRTFGAVKDLPVGYQPEDWTHSRYWKPLKFRYELGTLVCKSCGYREKKKLVWPNDAFFQIAYKSQVLWAFDRDSTMSLRDFIASTHRDRRNHRYQLFLRHIPSHFLAKHAREPVVKKLASLIEGSSKAELLR